MFYQWSPIIVFPFQLIAEIKKVFASATVTGEEFPRLMAILNMTYLPKSTAGQVGALTHLHFFVNATTTILIQTEMATMVTTMADLDMSKDFDYARCDRIIFKNGETQIAQHSSFSVLKPWTDCCSVPHMLSLTSLHL